ncbi:response regulator transcription factor [Gillisia sp. CAL575]|uniref:response regulator transcription factor n=1 Tax=Gillisia sp. CAL575 TaxID=985255 RepID=UPI0003A12451|nr:LuxR C-terminal-related transcriptional regulator [Gillisia sp. CAL575]
MKVYESDLLSIHYEKKNNCFVQFWKESPESPEDLKNEFLIFTDFCKEYKPSNTLWLQENFCFPITYEIYNWIEEHVNIPCVENGNKKVAFVVGKDVLVHLSVMNSFKEGKSIISPLHFATEKEARIWMTETKTNPTTNTKITILFEGVDEEGNSIIKIKRPSSDISNTIKSFGALIEENNFIKTNISKFTQLTKREKEILVIFSKGMRHQEVADELFISVQTLRKHWKNIKNKLEIKSLVDVILYVNAFDME